MGRWFPRNFIFILFAVILVIVGFGFGQYYLQKGYQTQMEAGYRRAFREFAANLGNVASEIGVARVAVSETQVHSIAANVRRFIYAAQASLGQLPLAEVDLEHIERVMDQIYRDTFFYEQGRLSQGEIDALYKQVSYLDEEIQAILSGKETQFPWVSWKEYFTARISFADSLAQALTAVNAGLGEMNDSDPLTRSRGQIDGPTVSKEQAVDIAASFSGRDDVIFEVINQGEGQIPTYTVEGRANGETITIEVSRSGGLVLWMMNPRTVSTSELSIKQMAQKGKVFLEERGFPPVHMTDVQVLNNRATLTYVPVLDGVLRYTEPLRVQVSAADGTILGFQGVAYYSSRSRGEVETSGADGLQMEGALNDQVQVLDEKLALILNDQQEEVLTYRFGVQYQEDYFLIYLNAQTGEEERIVPVASGEFF